MKNITNEQLGVAYEELDSLKYWESVTTTNAEVLKDSIEATQGCLRQEVRDFGLTSKTPTECPVKSCGACFDSGRLAVANETTCVNPTYQRPDSKY